MSLRLNPEFNALGASGLTTESYYVLSRVDGRASLHELILMTGFGVDKTVGILTDLRERGALLLPDETPEQVRARMASASEPEAGAPANNVRARAARAPTVPATPSAAVAAVTVALELDDATLTDAERAALEEDVVLAVAERRRALAMLRRIRGADFFTVLGVARDVDKRTLKRSYFKLSKEFHPDRYYGKQTGSFGPWLAAIFETCSKAYDTLSDKTSRARYEGALAGRPAAELKKGQTKSEHAASLFADACGNEVRGDYDAALRLFGAVIRLDPQVKYLARAARCAVRAESFDTAEEYAKKAVGLAPKDASIARILADAYRGANKLDAAERTLLDALEIKNENDVLSGELQEDLAAVRKLRETR